MLSVKGSLSITQSLGITVFDPTQVFEQLGVKYRRCVREEGLFVAADGRGFMTAMMSGPPKVCFL